MITGAWSESEVKLLVQQYPTQTGETIAAALNRSLLSVQNKVRKLKLAKPDTDPAVGDRFHFFEVIGPAAMRQTGEEGQVKVVPVRCDCGTEKEVRLASLKQGATKSCGCYNREAASQRMFDMNIKNDLPVGYKSGRLTVAGKCFFMDCGRYRLQYAVCECECGEFTVVSSTYLRKRTTRSCGCLRNEMAGNRTRTHGMSKTRLYREWAGIITRCTNKNDISYKNYGERGVTVCEEWLNSFEEFRDWALANGYSDELTIDRIDNHGDYTPENCRYGDDIVQANNRRNNRLETCWGETKTVANWSRDPRCQVSHEVLQDRLQTLGWSIEVALTTPKMNTRPDC